MNSGCVRSVYTSYRKGDVRYYSYARKRFICCWHGFIRKRSVKGRTPSLFRSRFAMPGPRQVSKTALQLHINI